MKRKNLFVTVILVPLLLMITTTANAHRLEPLVLGALGTAMGFAIGGSAADAAIGGAAGVAAGILLGAPRYAEAHYHYDPYRYGYRHYWTPGYSRYNGGWYHRHQHQVWVPGHYNYYGEWIPGHWR